MYIDEGKEYQIKIIDGQLSIYDADNNNVDRSTLSDMSQFLFESLDDLMKSFISEIVESN